MLTLSVLYLICYILTLVLLFIFLKTNKLLKCANKFSFTAFISYVNIYVNDSILFKFLLAHLSGVAPAFLFYLKFNFLITVLHQTHFFFICVIFLNLLLSTFYYLRVLSKTEIKLSKKLYKIIRNSEPKYSLTKTHRKYWSTYSIFFFLILSTAGLVFLPIFFIILDCAIW